jgi:hypothetical protein
MGVDPAVLRLAGITIDDTTWTWADFERIAIEIFQKTGMQTMPPKEFHQIFEHIRAADQRVLLYRYFCELTKKECLLTLFIGVIV